jgi:hypothetical protein
MREGEPNLDKEESLESQSGLLAQPEFLSVEEISKIRSDKHPLSGHHGTVQVRDYKFGETEVSAGNVRIDPSDLEFKKNEKKIEKMIRQKEKGEVYPCERVIVNALFEQARIADAFDVPTRSFFNLEFIGGKTQMMAINMGSARINVLVLRDQINSLQKDGASDEQVITEISGHMFHETLHMCSDMESGFLQGRQSVGEFTSITGQLAYYILRGYNGPSSYDNAAFKEGMKKIKDGEKSARDYETATCVSAELLLEHIKSAYPEFASDIEAETALDACEAIVAKIPSDRKDVLIQSLKQAILESTDEEKFKEVIKKLKNKNNK